MKVLPDLWDDCYEGEHRKALAPEQFKKMFCNVCLNPGCRNSRGSGSKWNQRMLTQEDRLLNNPHFAPEDTAVVMGLPDFKDMVHQALALEISDRKGDWEVVTEAEVGKAAAELVGVIDPSGFQKPPEPPDFDETEDETDSDPTDPTTVISEPEDFVRKPQPELSASTHAPKTEVEPTESEVSESTPSVSESTLSPVEGQWRVRGDSRDQDGRSVIYDVTLYEDGSWECSCPSREIPCKHARDIALKMARSGAPQAPEEPAPNPTRPPKRETAERPSFNTNMPTGGVMVGGGAAPPPEPDPWAPPTGPEDRVIGVGGKVTFGSGKKK
jgi:hypothetical protein